jgi:hypothetical protein
VAGTITSSPERLVSDCRKPEENARHRKGRESARGGGFRIPGANELASLVDFSKSTSPAIDPTAFPGTPDAAFWTSTTVPGNPIMAVTVAFDGYGNVHRAAASGAGHVRCVR